MMITEIQNTIELSEIEKEEEENNLLIEPWKVLVN